MSQPTEVQVAGVILAAGLASRMGRAKQLLEYQGVPLLQHVISAAEASRLTEVVVVLGAYADVIAAVLPEGKRRLVINDEYETGQASSVLAGLAAIAPDADAVVFLLGDQPGITAAQIDSLIDRWSETSSSIVATGLDGQPRNPVLFDRAIFPELAELEGDVGARPILQRHRDEVVLVSLQDPSLLLDIDDEADYQELISR